MAVTNPTVKILLLARTLVWLGFGFWLLKIIRHHFGDVQISKVCTFENEVARSLLNLV